MHQRLRLTLGTLRSGHALRRCLARDAAQQPKPNILFILADNLGYGDLGVYGGGELRGAPTPRIDELAARD